MAVLIEDEKWLVSVVNIFFWLVLNATGYHPGPVPPPTTDGASLAVYFRNFLSFSQLQVQVFFILKICG